MKFKKVISLAGAILILVLMNVKTGNTSPLSDKEYFDRFREISEEMNELRSLLEQFEEGKKGVKSKDDIEAELQDLYRQLEELNIQLNQPDTSSPYWKPINEELGLMVFKDRFGRARGTLFVKIGDYWKSIALEGVEELGPLVLPGKGS